jgi:type I restriction enzyme S subunit
MGEWKEYKFSDLMEIFGGGTPKTTVPEYWGGNIPWLSVQDFNNGKKYCFDAEKKITEKGLKESSTKILKKGQIIISARGTVGVISMLGRDMAFNQSNYGINANSELTENEFLYYLLKHNIANFISNSYGAVFDTITKETFDQIIVSIPEKPEQKSIASILSTLDDKIDLLHRQSKTLEALAETLFRQWFVEEADESWEVQPLGNLVTVKRGGSPRPIQDYLSTSGLRWLKISDVTSIESPFIFEIKEHIKEDGLSKTVFLNKGSIVLSNSATPGIPKLLQVDTCIHDGWLYFPKSYFSNEFLYLLFNMIRPQLLMQGNGSIFTNLKTDIIKEYKIAIPPEDHLLVLQTKIKYLFDKQLFNTIQIRTLTQLRDTLLPKLMSGEIRLNCDLCD